MAKPHDGLCANRQAVTEDPFLSHGREANCNGYSPVAAAADMGFHCAVSEAAVP